MDRCLACIPSLLSWWAKAENSPTSLGKKLYCVVVGEGFPLLAKRFWNMEWIPASAMIILN